MKLIGIDVGTGGTRVLLIDAAGKVVGSTVREHAPVSLAAAGLGGAGSRRLVAGGGSRHPRPAEGDRDAIRRDRRCRFERPDAWRRVAGRSRPRPPARAHLVRSADRSGSCVVDRAGWCGAADPTHLQPRAHQLHPDQAALGARARTRHMAANFAPSCCPRTTCASG